MYQQHKKPNAVQNPLYLQVTTQALWGQVCTSWRPPEHAKESGVSFVRSDCASISPPLSRRISTTPTCPAVAARIKGVKPSDMRLHEKATLSISIVLLRSRKAQMGWFTMTSVDHVSSSDWGFPAGCHSLRTSPNLFWPCHIEALILAKGCSKET